MKNIMNIKTWQTIRDGKVVPFINPPLLSQKKSDEDKVYMYGIAEEDIRLGDVAEVRIDNDGNLRIRKAEPGQDRDNAQKG